MKILPLDELKLIAGNKGLNMFYIEKDYYLTAALYFLKDAESLAFKGGTALNKTMLNHSRLSEDLDFTVTKGKDRSKINLMDHLDAELFNNIEKVGESGYTIRYKLSYESEIKKPGFILLDLNFIAKAHLPTEKKEIKHFYKPSIPKFEFTLLAEEELIAEKVSAMITRNQPRDYYDVYQIIKRGYKVNMELVREKVEGQGKVFDIEKIFRRGNRVYSRWESDLIPLTAEKVTFEEVMQALAEYFKYKEHKETKRKRLK